MLSHENEPRALSASDLEAIANGATREVATVSVDPIQAVARFIKKFYPDFEPKEDLTLDADVQRLRIELIREELTEYEEAVAAGDMVAAFDALIDLMYVVIGAGLMHGFPLARGFEVVHIANMHKMRVEAGPDTPPHGRGSKYDVVKPHGWTHPNMGLVLAFHSKYPVTVEQLKANIPVNGGVANE